MSEQEVQATPGRRFERPADEDAEAAQETIAAAPTPSRTLARVLSGTPRPNISHGRYRRVYAFFEAGALLAVQQAQALKRSS